VRFRLCVAVFVLAGLAILPGSTPGACQSVPVQNGAVNSADSEDILRELAPDDAPPPKLTLKPAARARAIRLLVAVKRGETGWRRQLAIYLLMTLGYDNERNREELLRVWRGCVAPHPETGCDDDTMELIVWLYEQGHKEFLRPLLAGGPHSGGALSEGLGTFYSEQLERNPRDFVSALGAFSPREQSDICELAGGTDGGGMGPKTERKVLANLKAIGGELADRCARGVRLGNREVNEADREEQQEIEKQTQTKPKKR
jgi:hypothetical protein